MGNALNLLARVAQNILQKFGVRLIRTNDYFEYKIKVGQLSNYERWAKETEFPKLQSWVMANIENSSAQLQQDLVAAFICENPGFFVEFGATNGLDLSNTYLLEKEYNWTGLLVEPGRYWLEELSNNRANLIDHRAVTGKTGEIRNFLEAKEGEYSTFEEYSTTGVHQHTRDKSYSYKVTTVSLNDLLDAYQAPSHIQLISIDTEGSELEILQSFNFQKYKVELFFVEHNYTDNRLKIDEILRSNGFLKFLPEVSQFDGWYIDEKIKARLK
jgi:FkbM family methyltransferase